MTSDRSEDPLAIAAPPPLRRPIVLRDPEPELAAARETKLEMRGVGVWYGTRLAVRDVNLAIAANAVTALIGPSGCGKSTILRCFDRMNDLIPGARVEGKIVLNGEDIYARDVLPV